MKAAREADPVKQAEYMVRMSKYQPHELVFVDESSFDRRTCIRWKAWGLRGERVFVKNYFLRGTRSVPAYWLLHLLLIVRARYSVLPALSLEGTMHVSVVEGSFNTAKFNTFVCELLPLMNRYDPETHPKHSVLVMDNCHVHKDPDLLAYIEALYVCLLIML